MDIWWSDTDRTWVIYRPCVAVRIQIHRPTSHIYIYISRAWHAYSNEWLAYVYIYTYQVWSTRGIHTPYIGGYAWWSIYIYTHEPYSKCTCDHVYAIPCVCIGYTRGAYMDHIHMGCIRVASASCVWAVYAYHIRTMQEWCRLKLINGDI